MPGAETTGNAQIVSALGAPFVLEGLFSEAEAEATMDAELTQGWTLRTTWREEGACKSTTKSIRTSLLSENTDWLTHPNQSEHDAELAQTRTFACAVERRGDSIRRRCWRSRSRLPGLSVPCAEKAAPACCAQRIAPHCGHCGA